MKELPPKNLQLIESLAFVTLVLLLIIAGGFLWGEFERVCGI